MLEKIPPFSNIDITYLNPAKPAKENLALAHVYGTAQYSWMSDGWPLLIFGDGGRDLTCYNLVTTPNFLWQGGTHYSRLYFVMDRFDEIGETAKNYAPEAIQDNTNINSPQNSNDFSSFETGQNPLLRCGD